ncbi:hypothetical protein HY488_03045 [Candidatus Woesearchaeota archaeon]|nr:hypothetical protein [Candidatus Woesearchaeota archaeon]
MNKRIMIIASIVAIALLLLLVGCEEKKTPAKKKTNATPTAQNQTAQQPTVKPVDVEAMPKPAYSLEYCNKRLNAIRDDLQSAQDNLADEQEDLKALQAEPKNEDRDNAIAGTTANIRALTNEVSSLQRGLESMDSKCKEITASVCAEFLADAQDELNDQKQELLNEQRELEYIRDAKRQDLQRRKVALFERRVNEWITIVEELQTKCK